MVISFHIHSHDIELHNSIRDTKLSIHLFERMEIVFSNTQKRLHLGHLNLVIEDVEPKINSPKNLRKLKGILYYSKTRTSIMQNRSGNKIYLGSKLRKIELHFWCFYRKNSKFRKKKIKKNLESFFFMSRKFEKLLF